MELQIHHSGVWREKKTVKKCNTKLKESTACITCVADEFNLWISLLAPASNQNEANAVLLQAFLIGYQIARSGLDVMYQTREAVFHHIPNTEKRVENTTRSGGFLTEFKVLQIVIV